MFCMVPKFNTETKKEASNYAKQMYSLLPSIGQMATISHKEFKDLNCQSVLGLSNVLFQPCLNLSMAVVPTN